MTTDRLLVDVMLGSLATYLRMCGYDTAYALDRDITRDKPLRDWANAENRTIVTRDRDLAVQFDPSVRIQSRDVEDQLAEIYTAGFPLNLQMTRCSVCNCQIERVPPEERTIPEYVTDLDRRKIYRCQDCGQYYWRGSHWHDVARTVRGAVES